VQERRFSVLGTWAQAVDPARALEIVAQWSGGRHRSYVCLANVHGLMEVRRDPELRRRLWRCSYSMSRCSDRGCAATHPKSPP